MSDTAGGGVQGTPKDYEKLERKAEKEKESPNFSPPPPRKIGWKDWNGIS
jgi:hypothetical protein